MISESITPLASIPLYVAEGLRLLTPEERYCLENLKEEMVASGGANFVSSNRQILDLPEFANFKKMMQEYLNHYANNILKLDADFYITDTWSTRNPKGTSHTAHQHGNSIFSGVYYVDVESGDLELFFDTQYNKSFKFKYDIKEWNTLNSSSWQLGLKPGLLVIFPSWVSHGVTKNLHDKDRRIIGWNCFVRGKFGSDKLIDNITIG